MKAAAIFAFLAAGGFAQEPAAGPPAEGGECLSRQIRLVDSYRISGDYGAAERILRECLPLEHADSESRLINQIALADLLREEDRSAEARKLFVQTMDSPKSDWKLRLDALIGMADIDLNEGDLKGSIDGWDKALEIARDVGDARSEAIALRGLGSAWLESGSAARAEPLLRRSLQMLESDVKSPPSQVAASLGAMAGYYLTDNKLALAEDTWSRALTIQRATLGENHPQVAYTMEMLAGIYSQRGETELACEYGERAAEMMRRFFGEGSPVAATALANLAMVEERVHALGDAATNYEAAVGILRQLPNLRPTAQVVLQHYAAVLRALHRNREAKAVEMEIKAFRPGAK
jgi:tetratricopeptide (TPR) repeat protein